MNAIISIISKALLILQSFIRRNPVLALAILLLLAIIMTFETFLYWTLSTVNGTWKTLASLVKLPAATVQAVSNGLAKLATFAASPTWRWLIPALLLYFSRPLWAWFVTLWFLRDKFRTVDATAVPSVANPSPESPILKPQEVPSGTASSDNPFIFFPPIITV